MSEILETFGIGRSSIVIVAALFVWLAVVGCAASSVITRPCSRRERIVWLAIIVCVPLLGLIAYLPFSVHKSNHPFLFQSKQ
ncbi:MAG: PLDc N-terminal domain-containing protein [Verrucomicrobia bacterium]|nr:PLDc N-terminal domain-containing protein [Verrucomicrobiota bacterium]